MLGVTSCANVVVARHAFLFLLGRKDRVTSQAASRSQFQN